MTKLGGRSAARPMPQIAAKRKEKEAMEDRMEFGRKKVATGLGRGDVIAIIVKLSYRSLGSLGWLKIQLARFTQWERRGTLHRRSFAIPSLRYRSAMWTAHCCARISN